MKKANEHELMRGSLKSGLVNRTRQEISQLISYRDASQEDRCKTSVPSASRRLSSDFPIRDLYIFHGEFVIRTDLTWNPNC